MDSLSSQVVSAAKLPILNPNEFDLWKIRIKQYFLMTDYSLWEVILNGDSPVSTRIVEGVSQPVALTTAEQRLARKNELKVRGTLLMALPDKHQLKFNSHKDAKTLMEAIEKRFRRNTKTKKVQKNILKQQFENFTSSSFEGLDQIHDRLQKLVSQLEIHGVSLSQEDVNLNLKIYETEVKQSSSPGTASQNLAFVSSTSTDSTTDSVSAAASVSAACVKLPASPLPNVDSLSNAIIYSFFANQSTSPQFDNEDLKQIDVDDLEEMDLRWQMAMLTMRARRKGHFDRECRSPKDPRRPDTAEPQRRTVPAGLESVEARLLVYKQNESVFEENIKLLNIEVQLRDTALVTLRQKLDKAEQERDDLRLKLEKFQTSSKNLIDLLAKNDCESWPPSNLYDRFQPSGGYHAVPPPYTGTFMPPNLDLVFNTAPIAVETDHLAFNVQLSPLKSKQDLSHTSRPSTPIIKDWVFDFEEESEPKAPQHFVPSFAQSSEHVKTPRHYVQPIETTFQAATSVPASPKSNSSDKKRNRKACFYVPVTHSKPQKHRVPTAVLTQSKPISNTAVRPVSAALPNITVTRPRHAHQVVTKSKSSIRRHLTRNSSSRTSNSPPRVNVVQVPVVSAAQGKQRTWVWRPKCPILDHDFRTTSASMTLKQFDYNDALGRSNGCSRHMIGNMSYLSDFEELNGGYVTFGGNPKCCKITGKGIIKTGELDFDNVYFVKELKFNLFSVSQMCDKKNNVLFTDSECLVLSSDFKFPDESQVLFRVPRENNKYNVNLKNIVPSGDLTCLFAKATLDES
nr:ribonuclease H-like domain-containing protein [Tanacetum cinerariifolium]